MKLKAYIEASKWTFEIPDAELEEVGEDLREAYIENWVEDEVRTNVMWGWYEVDK